MQGKDNVIYHVKRAGQGGYSKAPKSPGVYFLNKYYCQSWLTRRYGAPSIVDTHNPPYHGTLMGQLEIKNSNKPV